MKRILLSMATFALLCANAQNNRLKDHNNIGWYATTLTIPVAKKWSIHTEFQWRRDDYISKGQQNLLRAGINYKVNPNLTLRAGYAFAETFNYGDFPIQAAGKTFDEHRLYEMATLTAKLGKIDLTHRYMFEQRWVEKYSSAALSKPDAHAYVNRLRYMLRAQVPFSKNQAANGAVYGVVYDEILIGFGKNVTANVYDQNRFGALVGVKLSAGAKLETGFLSQIVQLGRLVNNQNVFQFNNGFIVSLILAVPPKKAG